MKVAETKYDFLDLQRCIDVVKAEGFGCEVEDKDSYFLVRMNNCQASFKNDSVGYLAATMFVNEQLLEMQTSMRTLLSTMQMGKMLECIQARIIRNYTLMMKLYVLALERAIHI